MVTQCGLNDVVGPMYLADEKHLSEQLKQKVDGEVGLLLQQAKQDVMALLTEKAEVGLGGGGAEACPCGVWCCFPGVTGACVGRG